MPPDADSAGRLCEPNAHQRIHSGLDVSKRRNHIDIMERRALGKLMQQQKQRRQGLVAGARKLSPDCYMDADGVVHGPVPLPDLTPVPEVGCQVPAMPDGSSASYDGANGENSEQKEKGKGVEQEAGQIGRESGDIVLSDGDARPTGPGPGLAELPEWLNNRDWTHQLASRSPVPLLPTLPSSAAGWAGYTAVGSA